MGDDQTAEIRRALLAAGAFDFVEAFPPKDNPARRVFRAAKLSTAVFGMLKTSDALQTRTFLSRVNSANVIDDGAPSLMLSKAEIPLYDP